MWMEARNAMLIGKMRDGAENWGARDALELATRGGAACLGRSGELGQLSVGSVADFVCWKLDGVRYAGAISDPAEAWLRCGPTGAHHTVINGKLVVAEGHLVSSRVPEMLSRHRLAAQRIQAPL